MIREIEAVKEVINNRKGIFENRPKLRIDEWGRKFITTKIECAIEVAPEITIFFDYLVLDKSFVDNIDGVEQYEDELLLCTYDEDTSSYTEHAMIPLTLYRLKWIGADEFSLYYKLERKN